MGWMTMVQCAAGAMKELFFFCHCIQAGSCAHPACYPMGTGGSFPGVKVTRAQRST